MTKDDPQSTPDVEADIPELDAPHLTCFVIGPIGNRMAKQGSEERIAYEEAIEVYEEIISAACSDVGLAPVRADGLARAGEITEQIFRRLRDDDVVIADVTGANANVMYELGLRHTRNKLTLQVGEYGRLPFDVNVIRTVMFSRSQHGLIQARKQLVELLETGLAGEFDPVSATRVWLQSEEDESESTGAEVTASNGSDEDDDQPGFLDLIAASEEKQAAWLDASNKITSELGALGDLARASTAEIQEVDARGGGIKPRLPIIARFASNLNTAAERIEEAVNEYLDALAVVSGGNLAIIEILERDPSQVAASMEFGLSVRGLVRVAREAMSGLGDFVNTMEENARAAQVLRPPTRRLSTAFERLRGSVDVMDEWDRRLQALGFPVPPEDEVAEPADEPGEGQSVERDEPPDSPASLS
jgi:hypothetical protein